MSSTVTHGFLDEALGEWIGLPHLARVLDPEALSRTLDRPAQLRRVRIKPGRSLLAGWQDPSTPGPTEYGWVAVLADADKSAGARRRAARAGAELRVHADGSDDGVALLSGGLDSDPGIARELAHARRRLPTTAGVDVLAYNPGRRIVLDVELLRGNDARQVIRVGAEPQDHLIRLARQWRGHGAPTVPVRRVGRRGTAVVSPRWGRGDLSALPDPAAAEVAGRAIGHLHATSARDRTVPGRIVPESANLIGVLLPALADRVRTLGTALEETLGRADATSLVHGDLSPDQVLWDGDRNVRIIDLDRSAAGAPESDVGSWLAACILAGQPDLAVAFVAGHQSVRRRVRPSREQRAAWSVRALLASALEPFRRLAPDWRQRVSARIALAEDVLAGHGGLP